MGIKYSIINGEGEAMTLVLREDEKRVQYKR